MAQDVRQRKAGPGSHPLYLKAVEKVGADVARQSAALAKQRWRWRKLALRALPRDASRYLADSLADYANSATGVAWPSQATLAAQVGVTVRTIRTALRTLERLGFVRSCRVGKRETLLVFLTLPDAAGAQETEASASSTTGNETSSTTGNPFPPIYKKEPQEGSWPSEPVSGAEPEAASTEGRSFDLQGEPSSESPSPVSTVEKDRKAEEAARAPEPPAGHVLRAADGAEASRKLGRAAARLLGADMKATSPRDPEAFLAALKRAGEAEERAKAMLGRDQWTALGRRMLTAEGLPEGELIFALHEARAGRDAA